MSMDHALRKRRSRWTRYPDIARRFWQHVSQVHEGCWLWKGAMHSNGYGSFTFHSIHYLAHRLSYALTYGPIPDGLYICHHCDVKPCVRPDHLFVGTAQDNATDATVKGQRARKLTAAAAQDIRRLYAAGVPQKTLSEQFHVSNTGISGIIHGKSWKHLDDPIPQLYEIGQQRQPGKKLTPDQVRIIRTLRPTHTLEELATIFHVHLSTIHNVCERKQWKHIE